MHREYLKSGSRHLGKPMECLWFGHSGPPVLIFPTSLGRFYQCEDFSVTSSLSSKVDAGEMQLVCADSVDAESWYNDQIPHRERVQRHEQYDAYLHDELMPCILHRSGHSKVTTFGASFGAYHAANVAARYPEMVRKAVLFSGVFDIHRFLDGFWNDACYFHCPTAYISNADEHWIRRFTGVEWIVATGEGDPLIEENRQFSGLLTSRGIPNYLEVWQGFGHDWPWWKEHAPRFLP